MPWIPPTIFSGIPPIISIEWGVFAVLLLFLCFLEKKKYWIVPILVSCIFGLLLVRHELGPELATHDYLTLIVFFSLWFFVYVRRILELENILALGVIFCIGFLKSIPFALLSNMAAGVFLLAIFQRILLFFGLGWILPNLEEHPFKFRSWGIQWIRMLVFSSLFFLSASPFGLGLLVDIDRVIVSFGRENYLIMKAWILMILLPKLTLKQLRVLLFGTLLMILAVLFESFQNKSLLVFIQSYFSVLLIAGIFFLFWQTVSVFLLEKIFYFSPRIRSIWTLIWGNLRIPVSDLRVWDLIAMKETSILWDSFMRIAREKNAYNPEKNDLSFLSIDTSQPVFSIVPKHLTLLSAFKQRIHDYGEAFLFREFVLHQPPSFFFYWFLGWVITGASGKSIFYELLRWIQSALHL